jgi:hypothetical protein
MKKSILLVIISLIITGLVITSTASTITQKTNPEENEIIAQYASVQCKSLAVNNFRVSKQPLSFAGIPITGGDYDEYHGSVARAPGGEYYAMVEYTEDDVTWHPLLYRSFDGFTWEALGMFLNNNSKYTDMDQNDYGTYGTFGAPPDNSGLIVVVQGETSEGSVWDFAPDKIYDFSNNRIDCYTYEGPEGDPGIWNWGCITLTGYNGHGSSDIEGCAFIFYPNSAKGGIISWLSTPGCEHVGSAMDLTTNIHYAVYDVNQGGNYGLLVRRTDFGTWYYNSAEGYWTHPSQGAAQVTSDKNLMYPSVVAYNNNVIVACQKGNDVVVYYSNDGFQTRTEKLVQGIASYPEVALAAGGIVVITYIKNNQIWLRTSDTGGASWSVAEVVSDNQVNLNDRAVNLDEYNGNIIGVWEDNRGDNIDIYYDLIYEPHFDPPGVPFIDGPTEGVAGEELCWTFLSEDPNDDLVKYFIQWGDGTSNETDFNPAGVPVEVCHTYIEQEEYTIKAYAEDETGLTSGSSTYTVTMPRSKAFNFNFNLLSWFLERFPMLERLLSLFR